MRRPRRKECSAGAGSMDNIAGILATRLGRTRAFVPANRLVRALQAAGANKGVGTTSNGVSSCDIGDGIIQQTKEKDNELHKTRSGSSRPGSQRDRKSHGEDRPP